MVPVNDIEEVGWHCQGEATFIMLPAWSIFGFYAMHEYNTSDRDPTFNEYTSDATAEPDYGAGDAVLAQDAVSGSPDIEDRLPETTDADVPRIDEFTAPGLLPGRSEVIMPQLGVQDLRTSGKIMEPPPTDVGIAQLNRFLGGLSDQGAEIAAVRKVVVDATDEWRARVPGRYQGSQQVLEGRFAFTVDTPPVPAAQPRSEYSAVMVPRWGTPDENTAGKVIDPLLPLEYEKRYNAWRAEMAAQGLEHVADVDVVVNGVEEERQRVPGYYDTRRTVEQKRVAAIFKRDLRG